MSADPASALTRLSGLTMGTTWEAQFPPQPGLDLPGLEAALSAAVTEIDAQMSPWKPDSALNRLSAAPPDAWIPLPAHTMAVLARGVENGEDLTGRRGQASEVTAGGHGSNKYPFIFSVGAHSYTVAQQGPAGD